MRRKVLMLSSETKANPRFSWMGETCQEADNEMGDNNVIPQREK